MLLSHGVGYRVLNKGSAVTVEFYYSSNDPMSYAEAFIFSPKDKEREYQNGRTDLRGRFAFCPNTAGTWRIEVSDGRGHKVRGFVEVKEIKSEDIRVAQSRQTGPISWPLGALLGVSLICNLFFIVYQLKGRESRY